MSSASASGRRRGGPGRPRLLPQQHSGTPREQILDAAARLFTSRGFAATSTREIAEAVGIRQASLYYHFAGKDEILSELLSQTIRPTVDSVARIESLTDDPDTALYLLALTDVRTLSQAPHNIGYLAPDVTQVEGFEEFTAGRDDLAATYARLAEPITAPSVLGQLGTARLGEQLVHTVEEVIGLRNVGRRIGLEEAVWIAASCLRLCGVEQSRIELAKKTAEILLDLLDDPEGGD